MSDPFIGEIRIFAGNFAPLYWMFCEGQLLAISQYDTLFELIGTDYGGDGQQTFALPDLRGRLPIHQGSNGFGNFVLGDFGGTETVTLTTGQIPSHSHAFLATRTTATATAPAGYLTAASSGPTISPYGTEAPLVALQAQSLTSIGGSQPHSNFQPYLCVSFIISLFGIFPSQN